MAAPLTKRPYYPALDGLRGIGCLLVVVYHNFWFLQRYLFFGWLAMDIFFVLSGFLITDILMNSMGRPSYLKNFYARRILRVFPLYFVFLALMIFVVARIPGTSSMQYATEHQAWFWTFTQNWLLIFRNPGGENALNHLWSMAVEEQFYLLWPLAVALVRRPKPLMVILGVLLVGFSCFRLWLWMRQVDGFAYYNFFLFTRIDGICIGCMVALLQQINFKFLGKYMALIVLGFAGINFIFYDVNLHNQNSFPYLGLIGFSTFSMIFGLLVYDITNQQTPFFSRMFDLGFLKLIGRISYGTYIFHWPLYLLLNGWMQTLLMRWLPDFPAMFATSAIITIMAYGLGYLSYRYFEGYFLNMKKWFK